LKKITKKKLKDTVNSLADCFDEDLFGKKESELDDAYWYFEYDPSKSLEWNLYQFYDRLTLYESFCRRWEEHHFGWGCVVERVRDKYLMPKIKQFASIVRGIPTTTRRCGFKSYKLFLTVLMAGYLCAACVLLWQSKWCIAGVWFVAAIATGVWERRQRKCEELCDKLI